LFISAATARAAEVEPRWSRLINDEIAEEQPLTLLRWNSDAEADGGPPALDEPLATDRPDFTEASCTVGRGVVQIESGYTYFFDNDGMTQLQAHSFPETLVRIGMLAEWFELRVAFNYLVENHRGGFIPEALGGFQDLYVGAKLGLTQQQGIWPEMALIPQARVPVGSAVFTSDCFQPGVNWCYGWDLTERWTFAGSTQANSFVDGETARSYAQIAQSLTTGYMLTEKLGWYGEWFFFSPWGADTAVAEHYLDSGFFFVLTNTLQFDLRAGKGIGERAIDYFSGAGVSVRF
jgi:hypothetical protein